MGKEESEWREAAFASFVSDVVIQRRALYLAGTMREPGDPPVGAHDVTAARPYLRACTERMRETEFGALTGEEVAHLWARGALGQARYRAGRAVSNGRGKRRP